MTRYNYSKCLSKAFVLLLIEDHEMILFRLIQRGDGDTGHYGFCHIMRHAVMILSFFYKGQVKSPILHNTRDGSEFYIPYLSHYM